MSGANLVAARLVNANLANAHLVAADLYSADCSDANLQGANLSRAHTVWTNFTRATLTGETSFALQPLLVETNALDGETPGITRYGRDYYSFLHMVIYEYDRQYAHE